MHDLCQDLLAEYRDLAALCTGLDADDWRRSTRFHGWSAWDEVAHLCYFDETGLQSVHAPADFARDAAVLGAAMARGEHISVLARQHFAGLDGPALLDRWRSRHEALVAALAAMDAKARLAWYGPPMSARSFATARLMETWAHGQDVWDLLRRRRPATARLRHIAHLGVTTFGWTFVNRGLPVPPVAPHVSLGAPDSSTWTWGDPASSAMVRGSAEDFCLVVTQRRHCDDTALQWAGEGIGDWLALAQCFAGPPADGPAPGERRVDHQP